MGKFYPKCTAQQKDHQKVLELKYEIHTNTGKTVSTKVLVTNNVQKYKLFRKQVRVSNQNLSIMKCVNSHFS